MPMSESLKQKQVLYLGYVWPEPNSSAAGVRTLAIVRDLSSFGMQVSFASTSQKNRYSEQLESMGVQCHSISANDPTFDELLKSINPDVVFFDRFVLEEQFGWRVADVCPKAVRIIDTQDLHFLRRSREAGLDYRESDDMLRELASMLRSDLSLVISRFELDLLNQKLNIPSNKVSLLGFSYDAIQTQNKFNERKNIVFIGNFRHPPNYDAVNRLAKEIWPKIYNDLKSQIPAIEIHIYGSYPQKEMMLLDNPDNGFRVYGPCTDAVSTLSNYKLLIAPLRFGAGIKGKIADSWLAGTPVVTTELGAEGMGFDDGSFAGVVAKNPDEFLKAVLSIYNNEMIFNQYQSLGNLALNELFSADKNREKLQSLMVSVFDCYEQNRKENWMGKIIMREQMRSTKYLSKWIEEKSKK